MELANLFPNRQSLTVIHPITGETDWILTIVGIDSAEFNKSMSVKAQRLIDGKGAQSIEERQKDAAELVAACIVGWTGLSSNGVQIPYSPEKALELISDPSLSWVKEQVETFVNTRANFFRSSQATAGVSRKATR